MYNAVWSPFLGEYLNTKVEPDSVHSKYVVKILTNEAVVGHVHRSISHYYSFVLNPGGTMSATVTGAEEMADQINFCQRQNI